MKPKFFRLASDLHLEAFTGSAMKGLEHTFLPTDERDAESVLLLAGDISSSPEQLTGFIKQVEGRFLKVYYIPGNHEYYRHEYDQWAKDVHKLFVDNLKNTEFATHDMCYEEHDDWRIAFGILWSDGGRDPVERTWVQRALNDFRLIMKGDRTWTVPDMMVEHKKQKRDLIKYLKQPFTGTTIVMTHHMPSYSLCHPRFGNDINGGFASNCDDILSSDFAPNIWVHGHTHDTIDRKLGKVRIVCNPCGYRGEWNTQFTQYTAKFIKLENEQAEAGAL